MMRATTATQQGQSLAARRRDAWDEDAGGEDEEPGRAWTKVYAGGVKTRQYGDLVPENQRQPSWSSTTSG
jgi:hypothetical protein